MISKSCPMNRYFFFCFSCCQHCCCKAMGFAGSKSESSSGFSKLSKQAYHHLLLSSKKISSSDAGRETSMISLMKEREQLYLHLMTTLVAIHEINSKIEMMLLSPKGTIIVWSWISYQYCEAGAHLFSSE